MIQGSTVGLIKGDTRGFDYSSYAHTSSHSVFHDILLLKLILMSTADYTTHPPKPKTDPPKMPVQGCVHGLRILLSVSQEDELGWPLKPLNNISI